MPDSTETNTSNSLQKDKWTLMFLIMGDASLSASMISQLKELTDAGFQEHTNVLLYFDPNCNGKGARVYDVNHDRKQRSTKTKTVIGDGTNPFVRNIAQDCSIQSLQQIPAALSLQYFLTYSRSFYPAENYMLFLMGHGVIVGNDEFLPDSDDGSSITLAALGKILKEFGEKVRETKGDEFHLVAFHSCGMSSVELAFELQGSARYMIGTQGSAFPGSWPYRQILKKIFNSMDEVPDEQTINTSDEHPNELVKEILKGVQSLSFYNAHDFSDAGFSADLSMCNLHKDKVGQLKEALQILVDELKEGLKKGARDPIVLAHWESQSYFGESYTDLYDFCECLQKHCPEGGSHHGIWKASAEVKRVLESERCEKDSKTDPDGLFDQLIVFSDYYGPAYQHSNGLSIYFPWRAPVANVMTNYANYKFTEQLEPNSWMSFLDDYFFMTKRPMNGKDTATKDPSDISTTQSRLQVLPEELTDEQLLRLGPPPRQKPLAVAERIATLHKEIRTLTERVAILKKTGTNATGRESRTFANEAETLAQKMATLERETGTLAKETATLAASGKETATLAKEMATLAGKEMATLASTLAVLEKETATLAGTNKEIATLAQSNKETATLAKEMGTLAKEMGTLAKETATLSKETGTLSKETGSLAKETATLGLFGNTVIKNFDAPEGETISSRPNGKPNQGRDEAEVGMGRGAGR